LLKISGLIKGIRNPAPKDGQKGEEQGENWSRTHRKKLRKQGNNGAGQRTEQTEGGGTQQKARERTLETGTQRGGRLQKKKKNQRRQAKKIHIQSKHPDPNSKGEASTVLCSPSQGLRNQGKRRSEEQRRAESK
jgi:hypothetical protein